MVGDPHDPAISLWHARNFSCSANGPVSHNSSLHPRGSLLALASRGAWQEDPSSFAASVVTGTSGIDG